MTNPCLASPTNVHLEGSIPDDLERDRGHGLFVGLKHPLFWTSVLCEIPSLSILSIPLSPSWQSALLVILTVQQVELNCETMVIAEIILGVVYLLNSSLHPIIGAEPFYLSASFGHLPPTSRTKKKDLKKVRSAICIARFLEMHQLSLPQKRSRETCVKLLR